MGVLYAKDTKIFCREYIEIYIPKYYFDSKLAVNNGASIQTFGLLYTRTFIAGNAEPFKLFNVPVVINLMLYESREETININDVSIDVVTLQYPKDSYIMHQTIPNGRALAESFLAMVLAGKLPKSLSYSKLVDVWWKNLEIAGVSFKVPSKIFEMVLAAIYRNPHNPKERYGQLYGRSNNPSEYGYKADNVRSVVKYLSTFSGITFEDIGTMITSGINNSLEGVEEPVSPLEKIIHY